MAPKIKLVYFDGRGRAEITRLILNQAGAQFEDVRIAFEDWPKVKPTTPFGSLPYMEIDGNAYAESQCLARWAARKFNLMGKDDLEALQCDAIFSLAEELRAKAIRIKFDSVCSEDQKGQLKKTFEEEQLPAFLGKMEKMLTDSKSGFLVGKAVSMAELVLYDITETPLKEIPTCLDKFPKVAAMRKTVEAQPNIKKYLSTRKDTAM